MTAKHLLNFAIRLFKENPSAGAYEALRLTALYYQDVDKQADGDDGDPNVRQRALAAIEAVCSDRQIPLPDGFPG